MKHNNTSHYGLLRGRFEGQSKKSKEIAGKHNVAQRTVETHRARILMKMQVSSSIELTAVITKLQN